MTETVFTQDMTNHYIYFTAKAGTDTVHLADFDKASSGDATVRTLCGIDLAKLYEGDETASGFLATCKTCKKAAA